MLRSYHKFTHGKDIARYKKEDLIGIFGKEGNPESSVVPDKKEFIQKGNMEEYFRNKRSEKLKITDSSFQSETDRLEMKPILDNRDSKNDDIIDNLVNSSPKEVKSNGIIIPNETEYYSVSADGVGPCENKKKNRKEKYKKLEGEICNVYSDKPAFEVDRLLKFKNVTDQNIDSDARYTAHNSTNFNDDEKHISVSKKPSKRKRKHDEEAIFQRSTEIASASVPEETVIRKKMKSKNEDSSRVSKQETEKNEPNKEIVNHETEIDTRITDKNQQKNKLGLTPTKSSSEITKGSLELHSYSNSAVISKFENSSKRKKKKSKKYDDTSCDRSNELEVSEDTSESSIILRDSVEDFMKSIVDYNTASNVEDYINQFEKNREELLNKYREKYKTKHSLSSSQNIEVYGDDFDGRKLDCQKPKPEKKIAAEDLMKKSASKAARIIAKARLMKNIQDSTVTHNFKGSNLTDICGYGNLIC